MRRPNSLSPTSTGALAVCFDTFGRPVIHDGASGLVAPCTSSESAEFLLEALLSENVALDDVVWFVGDSFLGVGE